MRSRATGCNIADYIPPRIPYSASGRNLHTRRLLCAFDIFRECIPFICKRKRRYFSRGRGRSKFILLTLCALRTRIIIIIKYFPSGGARRTRSINFRIVCRIRPRRPARWWLITIIENPCSAPKSFPKLELSRPIVNVTQLIIIDGLYRVSASDGFVSSRGFTLRNNSLQAGLFDRPDNN